ncbi:MAG: hypothetical protein ABI851_16645 [Saprospiraceae bacterium]
MKNVFNFNPSFFAILVAFLLLSVSACTEEQVIPSSELLSNDMEITIRTDGPVSTTLVKQKVAVRDNIPLSQILTCTYYGQTSQGYWEYHLTTQYNGPKIYIVTKIIGDDAEGC